MLSYKAEHCQLRVIFILKHFPAWNHIMHLQYWSSNLWLACITRITWRSPHFVQKNIVALFSKKNIWYGKNLKWYSCENSFSALSKILSKKINVTFWTLSILAVVRCALTVSQSCPCCHLLWFMVSLVSCYTVLSRKIYWKAFFILPLFSCIY